MSAVDTSITVAALLVWHDDHEAADEAASGAKVPAHVLVETFSVLTRLPTPHRIGRAEAGRLLCDRFPEKQVLHASPELQRSLVTRLVEAGVEGGAAYDGLVALTAVEWGEVLVSRDQRAAGTYERLEVPFEIIGRVEGA